MQNFVQEFMEDYFAECEEHLTNVRHQLLALEKFVNQGKVDPEIVNRLFRSFHTLKGLSGMVGIQAAESLAHELESYLRLLRDEGRSLYGEGFDALMVGTKTLEEVIAAAHQQQALPDIQAVLAQLQSVLKVVPPASVEMVQQSAPSPPSLPKRLEFTFSPSPELAARGINVTGIRDRLQGIGEIVDSQPVLSAAGKVIFRFVVVTTATTVKFRGWKKDGLVWQVLPETEPEIKPESQEREPEELVSQTPTAIDPVLTDYSPEVVPTASTTLSATGSPLSPLMNSGAMVVRVELGKLDELMRMVGDLVISRARLEDSLKRLGYLNPTDRRSLQEINLTLERQLRDLREGVMRVRLVPIGDAFAKMQFVVRDLLRESNKEVSLEITGQDTEIDKFVVERMMDPLLHLVRNAISHGIESPTERQTKGKSPQGHIYLRARTSGETVVLEIEDDGRGINVTQVVAQGRSQGLSITPNKDGQYDARDLLAILCHQGFSTQEVADRVSGRGVGMAIVQNTINELGGLLDLHTLPDQGTRYTIQLPLTLAIADALIITVGNQTFAIPQTMIREICDLQAEEITTFETNEIFTYRAQVLSLIHLCHYFQLESIAQWEQNYRVVVVGNELNAAGIVVDRIIGLREIVIRPLVDPFVKVPGIAGATELGDGRVVLILDVNTLMRTSNQFGLETMSVPPHNRLFKDD